MSESKGDSNRHLQIHNIGHHLPVHELVKQSRMPLRKRLLLFYTDYLGTMYYFSLFSCFVFDLRTAYGVLIFGRLLNHLSTMNIRKIDGNTSSVATTRMRRLGRSPHGTPLRSTVGKSTSFLIEL